MSRPFHAAPSQDQSDLELYWLLFCLLRISPSYELARQQAQDGPINRAKAPPYFADVEQTYRELGDVRQVRFRDWWVRTARWQFQHPAQHTARALEFIPEGGMPDIDGLSRRLAEHLTDTEELRNRTASLVVSIPMDAPRAVVLQTLEELLATWDRALGTALRETVSLWRTPNVHTLRNGVRLLFIQAGPPVNLKLWQVGYLHEPTSAAAQKVKFNSPKPVGNRSKGITVQDERDARNNLGSATKRDLTKYTTIAENAARGIFVSEAPLGGMPALDFGDLRTRVAYIDEWEQANGQLRMLSTMAGTAAALPPAFYTFGLHES